MAARPSDFLQHPAAAPFTSLAQYKALSDLDILKCPAHGFSWVVAKGLPMRTARKLLWLSRVHLGHLPGRPRCGIHAGSGARSGFEMIVRPASERLEEYTALWDITVD